MKTEELINLLAEDSRVHVRLGRSIAMALIAGVAISSILMLSTVGIRSNMAGAILDGRVVFKIGVTILLALAGCGLLVAIGRPGVWLRARALFVVLALALVAAGVMAEMSVMPAGSWKARMVGHNARFCLLFIPILALGPLVAFLWVLRHGAPESPGLAGAVAGLAAGAIAGAIYAWHCSDDSPLFVATWYGLAIAFVTAAGWLAGRKCLRW